MELPGTTRAALDQLLADPQRCDRIGLRVIDPPHATRWRGGPALAFAAQGPHTFVQLGDAIEWGGPVRSGMPSRFDDPADWAAWLGEADREPDLTTLVAKVNESCGGDGTEPLTTGVAHDAEAVIRWVRQFDLAYGFDHPPEPDDDTFWDIVVEGRPDLQNETHPVFSEENVRSWELLGGDGHDAFWWDRSALPRLRVVGTDDTDEDVVVQEWTGCHYFLSHFILGFTLDDDGPPAPPPSMAPSPNQGGPLTAAAGIGLIVGVIAVAAVLVFGLLRCVDG